MFDNLSDKLQLTLKKIRGEATLTESNISEAMREIRMALLESDVNLKIAKEFVESVKQDCIGLKVLQTVSPGQQVIKIVNDRLVELMGDSEVPLDLTQKYPAVIMMVGLHGSGKTTSSAKLAVNIKKQNKKVMLVAADIYRPAAIDQLEVLGKEIDVRVFADRDAKDVALLSKKAITVAKQEQIDVVIIDTAGRLQIDEEMVEELVRIEQAVDASEKLLVADSALGQEAVSVADAFHKAINLTGVVLTKLDGDARGGAALSIRKVTNCPIKFIGVGEKVTDLEPFYPDRIVSRMLGMGDIVTLVEKAAEEINEKEAARLEEKMKKNSFDLDDFLSQLQQMKKMGGIEKILKLLPGGKNLASTTSFDPKNFLKMEALICSMTKQEKENPDIISFSRKKRISNGSGTNVEELNKLLKQFTMMRKMMKKTGLLSRLMDGKVDYNNVFGDMGGAGGMAGGMPSMGGGMGLSRGSNRTPKKKKRKKKKR